LGNDPLSLIFNKEMAALNTFKRLCVARTTRRGAVDRQDLGRCNDGPELVEQRRVVEIEREHQRG